MALRAIWSVDPVTPHGPQSSLNPALMTVQGLQFSSTPALGYLSCHGLSSIPGIVRKVLSYRSSLDFLVCAHFQGFCPCPLLSGSGPDSAFPQEDEDDPRAVLRLIGLMVTDAALVLL